MSVSTHLGPSVRTAWVIALEIDAYAKSVLHVLAHRADSTTYRCWITVDRLAMEAGMSPRKVQSVIRELNGFGLIKVDHSRGRKANHFELNFNTYPAHGAPLNPAQCAPLEVFNPAPRALQPRTPRHPTLHSVHPEQVLNREENKEAPKAPSIWDVWVGLAGEKNRPLLGKLIGEHGESEVAKAVAIVERKAPADPVSYIRGILNNLTKRRGHPTGVSL